MKFKVKEYVTALCGIALDQKESSSIRREAFTYMFKLAKAEKGVTEYTNQHPAQTGKNLPLAEKKTMVGLVYQAILKKLGRDDPRTMSLFKAAINHLSKDELEMEWEALEDGTVSNIVSTMINFDQQTEEVKQDIANIFEGLAKPYFVDYRGNVPKEDLKWAHNVIKDYFADLKRKEPLLKGSGAGGSPALPEARKMLPKK